MSQWPLFIEKYTAPSTYRQINHPIQCRCKDQKQTRRNPVACSIQHHAGDGESARGPAARVCHRHECDESSITLVPPNSRNSKHCKVSMGQNFSQPVEGEVGCLGCKRLRREKQKGEREESLGYSLPLSHSGPRIRQFTRSLRVLGCSLYVKLSITLAREQGYDLCTNRGKNKILRSAVASIDAWEKGAREDDPGEGSRDGLFRSRLMT